MRSTPIFKILSAAVLAAVVLLGGIQVYRYLNDPLSTTLAYNATVSDTIETDGWVIRQEVVLPTYDGALRQSVQEGEKVGAGQTVAMVYSDKGALTTVAQLEGQQLKLQQLQFAQSSFLDTDAALKVDSTISETILSLRLATADGDYSEASGQMSALKSAVLKRSHGYSSLEEIEAAISQTQQEIDRLQGSLSGARAITAPQSGTFSASCDGYESALTPEGLEGLTPSGLQSLSAGSKGGCKLIVGSTWYYAAIITEEQAQSLSAGSQVTLRLDKGLSQDVAATVSSLSQAEGGKVVAVLSCDRYLSEVTLLRHQKGQVLLKSYTGLRVPANALRLSEDGQAGVYCQVGSYAVFKPVDVLYRGDGFYLVQAASDASGERILRPGEQVLSSVETLYDGMVVGAG